MYKDFTMQCKCNALALYIFLEYNLSEQIKKTVKGGLYMGRNGTTERKIKEIQELLKAGTPVKQIVKEKFHGGIKTYLEFLNRNSEHFNDFPQAFDIKPRGEMVEAKKTANKSLTDVSKFTIGDLQEKNLEKLSAEELGKLLILYAPKLLSMISQAQHVEKINKFINEKDNLIKLDDVLVVPEEILKATDKRNRTLRLSEKLEKEFDEVVAQYGMYSKTDLLNLAVKDFIIKYKKS